jgi:hypothetical protein
MPMRGQGRQGSFVLRHDRRTEPMRWRFPVTALVPSEYERPERSHFPDTDLAGNDLLRAGNHDLGAVV